MQEESDTRLESFLRYSTSAAGILAGTLAIGRFAIQGFQPVGWVLACTSIAFFIQLAALRRARPLKFVRWTMPLTGLAGIACMSFAESRLGSEALFWLPFVPLLAVLSAGRVGAILSTMLACAWVGVLLLISNPGSHQLFQAFGLMGAVGFGGIVGLSYESSRQAEAGRLQLALEKSQAASEAKSNFLASMSHELRTPLNAIIGFSRLLIRGKSAPPGEDESYPERISRNGRHLLQLINDVLDVSKVEAGKLEVVREAIDVSLMVRECLSDYESLCLSRNISISFDDAQAQAMGDPFRTKQVVVNLLSNAIKFNEDGGRIHISLHSDDAGCALRLDVADTGPGISSEQAADVFLLFQQLEQSTSRRHNGTGLGLALSRRLCALMGFRLELVSTVGEGSTFSLYFSNESPILTAHKAVPPTSAQSSSPTL